MKYLPRNDYVIVCRDDSRTFSEGGIEIPDVAKKEKFTGTVIAVGPGKLLENGTRRGMDGLKEGVRVLFGRFSGNPVDVHGDKDIVYMRENEITAVIGEK